MNTTNALRFVSAIALSTLVACESTPGGGSYDPNAVETLGVVVSREPTGVTTRQRNPSTLLPVGGLFVPISLYPNSPELPILAYGIELEDGRHVTVYTWYQEHEVGGCVKLFESNLKRADYPRMTNAGGCKKR